MLETIALQAFDFNSLIPLIYIFTGGSLLYVFYHRWSTIKKIEKKNAIAVEKAKSKDENFNKIDEIINNAPTIVQQIDQMIIEMRNKGATDEQIKPLEEKKKLLMYAVKYGDLWNMGGKEIVGSLFTMVRGKLNL